MGFRLTDKQARELGIKPPAVSQKAKDIQAGMIPKKKPTPSNSTGHQKKQSPLEETLWIQIQTLGLIKPERELRFSPPRRWRFDFAWAAQRVAVECEGGVWSKDQHGHTNPNNFIADCEKYNAATLQGWRVFRYPGDQIYDWSAIAQIQAALIEFAVT